MRGCVWLRKLRYICISVLKQIASALSWGCVGAALVGTAAAQPAAVAVNPKAAVAINPKAAAAVPPIQASTADIIARALSDAEKPKPKHKPIKPKASTRHIARSTAAAPPTAAAAPSQSHTPRGGDTLRSLHSELTDLQQQLLSIPRAQRRKEFGKKQRIEQLELLIEQQNRNRGIGRAASPVIPRLREEGTSRPASAPLVTRHRPEGDAAVATAARKARSSRNTDVNSGASGAAKAIGNGSDALGDAAGDSSSDIELSPTTARVRSGGDSSSDIELSDNDDWATSPTNAVRSTKPAANI